MKNVSFTTEDAYSQRPNPKRRFSACLLVCGIALACSAVSTRAANLLVNPSFNSNSGHALPTGWTYFSPPTPPGYFGDYWVEGNVPTHSPPSSGTLYWKEWGAL